MDIFGSRHDGTALFKKARNCEVSIHKLISQQVIFKNPLCIVLNHNSKKQTLEDLRLSLQFACLSVVTLLSDQFIVPDLWQQNAVRALLAGRDVIVDAPTGAGKTHIFELLIKSGYRGKAVYTVPTRALANDKFLEWKQRGWDVGITTGDIVIDPQAAIVVATLETQKRTILEGKGPALLVVDEYQMLADPARGSNYEIVLAMAPAQTQLLLLSGSVANPEQVAAWLSRCGREVSTVATKERPVPLDEVNLESLPDKVPPHIEGHLPRRLARALLSGLGPVMVFAPKRRAAERLAVHFASMITSPDLLQLSPEQKKLAGPQLARILKKRVAYHHSGLSYAQRVGLIEPLAKNGQLKLICSTTGLGAGIHFSVRSVLVLDREYRSGQVHRLIRPDELLQMFGRAGRRGLDDQGSILFSEGKARLGDAHPLALSRTDQVDWPALLTLMHAAAQSKQDPLEAARSLTSRLFSKNRVPLGLETFLNRPTSPTSQSGCVKVSTSHPSVGCGEQKLAGGSVREFKNKAGYWERQRPERTVKLADALILERDDWRPALSSPRTLAKLKFGVSCRLENAEGAKRYGREAPLAQFPQSKEQHALTLTKWLRKSLRSLGGRWRRKGVPRDLSLEQIEKWVLPDLPFLTQGGQPAELVERSGTLFCRIDFTDTPVMALIDQDGHALLNPETRTREIGGSQLNDQHRKIQDFTGDNSVAGTWQRLGLLDARGHPTRRGLITSFFNGGEGLAIAAALEIEHYAIEELLKDLINLRAGHRFNLVGSGSTPLAAICREAYQSRTFPGYLAQGLPEDYGDGASELLTAKDALITIQKAYPEAEISAGDAERAFTEWRSVRCQIARAPDYPWARWRALRACATESIEHDAPVLNFDLLPSLKRDQTKRHPTLHWV